MLLASLQGAILASGLGTGGIAALELVAGIGVSLFFTLWDSTVQEQVPERGDRARRRLRLGDVRRADADRPGARRAGRRALGIEAAMRWGTVLGVGAALACLAVPAVRHVRRRADRPAAAAALIRSADHGAHERLVADAVDRCGSG